jgi:ABC-type multidrug transport system fused ATPase/permease subunit
MVQTSKTLFYIIFFYGTLAWYFDNIYEHNRGVPKPWYFPFIPSYWLPFLKIESGESKNTYDIDNIIKINPSVKKDQIDTAMIEAKRIYELEKSFDKSESTVDGVRVFSLSKTYRTKGTEENKALKNVSFEIQKGELLGVMGHNGAGKSTLINCICGLIYKDYGNARMFDYDIDENLRKVRKRMGIVSQFDVLWDELTGIEHM